MASQLISADKFNEKNNDNIKVFPLICPHEGGYLGINNEVGIKFTMNDYKNLTVKLDVIFTIEDLIQYLILI